jgi:Protein of unknown function (DUF3303)
MLFMVMERLKHGDAGPVGKRFKRSGRMLPEGVTYHESWVDSTGTRRFQVMETLHPELLNTWLCSLGGRSLSSDIVAPHLC